MENNYMLYVLIFITFLNLCQSYKEEKYDIVIIGAGVSGLFAAYEANKVLKDNTYKIAIFEKKTEVGGNSINRIEGINILNSAIQEENRTYDSYSLYYNDTLSQGKYIIKSNLIPTLVNESHNLYNFLVDEIGINLSLIKKLNGHSTPRTHFNPNDFFTGKIIVDGIYNKLKNKPNVTFIFNADIIELLHKDGAIIGLKYKLNDNPNIHEVITSQIIITTGGYGSDFYSHDSLLKEYVSSSLSFPYTSEPESNGKGIKLAKEIGASLIDMDKVIVHPTAFVDQNDRYSKKKLLASEILREEGGILLNHEGKRFCNELGSKDYIVTQILENGYKAEDTQNNYVQYEVYLLMNQDILYKIGVSTSGYYLNSGLIKKYDNLEHFAKSYGINFETLNNTIYEYNQNKEDGKDNFNKNIFPISFNINDTLYASVVVPSISYTIGGIKINKKAQVLNSSYAIKGLYAAGEVTGGIHGSDILIGNTLTESGVFGRIAGRHAALNLSGIAYTNYNTNDTYNDTEINNTTNFIPNKKSSELSGAAIAGIVIACVAITSIIVIFGLLICIPKDVNQNITQTTNISSSTT